LLYSTLSSNHHNSSSNIAQHGSASVFPVSHHPVGDFIAELEELQQDLSAAAVIPPCYQQAAASRAGGELSSLPGQPRAAVHQRAAYSVAGQETAFFTSRLGRRRQVFLSNQPLSPSRLVFLSRQPVFLNIFNRLKIGIKFCVI
jgi:hypothetical protein